MTRQKLITVLDEYLNDAIDKDFMAEFASCTTANEAEVGFVSDWMFTIAACEYPDFRASRDFKRLLSEIRDRLVSGEPVSKHYIASAVSGNANLVKLFGQKVSEDSWQRWAVLTVAIVFIVVSLVVWIWL